MNGDGKNKARRYGTLQPPDGGWGWMIVCGSALSQVFLIPILQYFTLIFKDRFTELGFTSTKVTTLVSLNASFGMILGLLNGPLLKIFGYRKMAFFGSTFYTIGILCTGIARSYFEFILFYGLLSSLGMVMVMASFSLAVNSYFLKKRSQAVGYIVTLTGLGPIAIPFVISWLLSSYGLKWTVFLLSGLNLHAYVGVFLLQPVRWHMKVKAQPVQPEDTGNKLVLSDVHSFLELSAWGSRMSLRSHAADTPLKPRKAAASRELPTGSNREVTEDRYKPRKLSVTFLDNDDYKNMMNSTLHMIERVGICEERAKCASVETLTEENGDCFDNFDKSLTDPLNPKFEVLNVEDSTLQKDVKPGLFIRFIRFLEDIYDLDLFHDPCYVNIMLGLSMAFVGEIIFSTMIPIIFKEIGFNTEETATFLSVGAGCDLICRFIAPFVGKKLNLNSKRMYLITLLMLLLSRAGMYLVSTYNECLLVSFFLGIAKGFRSVYWVLVLPDYVPLSKLASASAIQSLINGVLLLVSGPLIGAAISLTKSNLSVIVASNILTTATVLLWCGEIIYLKYKRKG